MLLLASSQFFRSQLTLFWREKSCNRFRRRSISVHSIGAFSHVTELVVVRDVEVLL